MFDSHSCMMFKLDLTSLYILDPPTDPPQRPSANG